MHYLIFIINSLVITGICFLIVWKMNVLKPYSYLGLAFKLILGLVVGLLYLHYFNERGDTWYYYSEAVKIGGIFLINPLDYFNYLILNSHQIHETVFVMQPRALFFSKLMSPISIISGGNYWLISIYLSLFSCFAAMYLIRELITVYPKQKLAICISFLLLPSAMLWTSGILKETISFGLLCFMIAIILQKLNGRKVSWIKSLSFCLMLIILWKIKYYYAALFIACFLTFLVVTVARYKSISIVLKYPILSFFVVFCVAITTVSLWHPNLNFQAIYTVIVDNYHQFVIRSNPGEYISYDWGGALITDMIINSPKALFYGIFMPAFWQGPTLFHHLYGIENGIIFLLATTRIISIINLQSIRYNLLGVVLLMFVLLSILFLALSAPNYGTLMRYKAPLMPFLMLLLLFDHPIMHKLHGLIVGQREKTS